MKLLSHIYSIFTFVFFDIREMLRKWTGIPFYTVNALRYAFLKQPAGLSISSGCILPVLHDRFSQAGAVRGHYFHQDLWMARKVKNIAPGRHSSGGSVPKASGPQNGHVDVGSRMDGFVARLLSFMDVTYG